jgi:hypothetical protein
MCICYVEQTFWVVEKLVGSVGLPFVSRLLCAVYLWPERRALIRIYVGLLRLLFSHFLTVQSGK